MNILETEDIIKGLPDEALMQEAQQPSGQVPQFLVISEVQRRSDMRKRHQQQSQEQPQGTVADQVLQEGIAGMAPPSPGMQQAMGGPPAQMMYGGGVVRMANGRQATIGERQDLYPGVALGARNPMSIRQYGQDWEGESGTYSTPSGGEFVEYEDPRYSYRAADRILQTYGREEGDRGGRGLTTLRQVISTYAPPSDKNPTESYVDYVSKMSGIPPDAAIDLSNPVIRSRVLSPMAMFESKTEISPEDLRSQISAIDEGYTGRLPPPPAIEPRSIDVDTSMDIPGISPGAAPGPSGLAGSSIEEVNYPVRQEVPVVPDQPNIYGGAGSTEELLNMIGGQGTLDEPFPSPSLGEINPTIDLPRQDVTSVPQGRVTVEELGVRAPGNLEELLAMATGPAGERVQKKIDATNASNAIKEDARKAKLDKRANRVSDSEYTAVANTKADMYATTTNQKAMDVVKELGSVAEKNIPTGVDDKDNSTKTGIMDSLSRYYRPGANIQQEIARREEAFQPQGTYALQQQKDIQSEIAQARAEVESINNGIDEITRNQDTTHPNVISELSALTQRKANAEERVNTLSSSLSPVRYLDDKKLEELEGLIGGLGGGEPQLGDAKAEDLKDFQQLDEYLAGGANVETGGFSQVRGGTGDTQIPSGEPAGGGGGKSDPIGVAGEMGAALATLRARPPLESAEFDISGIETDYSAFDQAETYNRLIEEQKVLADRARQEAKRDAGSMALVQLGAGIAAGDLSRGLSEAGSTAYDVRTSGRKEAREAEAAARALALSRAEGTQELQLLGRQAKNQAEMAKREFEAKDKAAIAKINYSTTMDVYNAEMDGIMNRIQIERFGDLKRQVDEAAYRQIMSTAMEMTKLALQENLGDLTEDKINSVFDNNVATATEQYKDLRAAGTTATGTGTAGAGAGAGSSSRFNIRPRPQDGSS